MAICVITILVSILLLLNIINVIQFYIYNFYESQPGQDGNVSSGKLSIHYTIHYHIRSMNLLRVFQTCVTGQHINSTRLSCKCIKISQWNIIT